MIFSVPIEIFEVRDRGIPNRECVVLKVNETTSLASFFVGIGFPQSTNNIWPINDNSFWLGSGFVLAGDWIYLYSGIGEPISSLIPNQDNSVHSIYWNRKSVLFGPIQVVPFVYSIENVHIAEAPEAANEQEGLGAFRRNNLLGTGK